MDPVTHMDEPFQDSHGWNKPGWYFWDETWSTAYGPYESQEIANERCKEYAEHL